MFACIIAPEGRAHNLEGRLGLAGVRGMGVSPMRRRTILALLLALLASSTAGTAVGHTGKMPVPQHNLAGRVAARAVQSRTMRL